MDWIAADFYASFDEYQELITEVGRVRARLEILRRGLGSRLLRHHARTQSVPDHEHHATGNAE